jgi:hypothetical protein
VQPSATVVGAVILGSVLSKQAFIEFTAKGAFSRCRVLEIQADAAGHAPVGLKWVNIFWPGDAGTFWVADSGWAEPG